MNAYQLSLLALIVGLLGQAVASGIAIECFFHRKLAASTRRLWFALAVGALFLGLHHGYSIELALKTGLYDFRQALLAGAAGLLYAIAAVGFSRRA